MKLFILFIVSAILFIGFTTFALAGEKLEEKKVAENYLKILLDSVENNDLDKFKSVCDEGMKKAMTQKKLRSVSAQMSGLMKQGYKTKYLGVVNRLAYKTYYWKLVFKVEGVPEVLASLTMSETEVSGFWIN